MIKSDDENVSVGKQNVSGVGTGIQRLQKVQSSCFHPQLLFLYNKFKERVNSNS